MLFLLSLRSFKALKLPSYAAWNTLELLSILPYFFKPLINVAFVLPISSALLYNYSASPSVFPAGSNPLSCMMAKFNKAWDYPLSPAFSYNILALS